MESVNIEGWLYVKGCIGNVYKGTRYVGRMAKGDNRLNPSLGVLS